MMISGTGFTIPSMHPMRDLGLLFRHFDYRQLPRDDTNIFSYHAEALGDFGQ